MKTARPGTPTRARAAALLVGGLLATGLVALPSQAAPVRLGTTSPRLAPGHDIDHRDKAAVAEAWRTRMKPNINVASGWTGSVDGCDAGRPSADAQRATLESLNFVRAMAGLDEVLFNGSLSREAQAAALIMDANDALSHNPPESWDCWTQTGYDAAGMSNLAWKSTEMKAGLAVELYMDDRGASNRVVGHRRWILNPFVTTMGNGLTKQANALHVFGDTNENQTNPAWAAWPSKGWFPTPLQPAGRWSLSSGSDSADFSHATVTVKRGTTRLPVTTYRPVDGYGQPTLVFQVKDLKPTGTYRVLVRHIRGIPATTSYAYKVRLFRP